VVELALPPLRARGVDDVARLARHFADAAAKRHARPVPEITREAMAKLCAYPWPGNVRELENCLESAVVTMDGERIDAGDLPLPGARTAAAIAMPLEDRVRTLEEVEREHIEAVLAKVGGNRTLAAKLLGIGRNTLQRKLARWGL
jgi:Nif-specific regulatory protein